VNVVSPTFVVRKFSAHRASSPASRGSDTRGGRVAASEWTGEQGRERNHGVRRQREEPARGEQGDRHHQLGAATAPAQSRALDGRERDAEQDQKWRAVGVDRDQREQDARAPRHEHVRHRRQVPTQPHGGTL
jgi:hypothetical protein